MWNNSILSVLCLLTTPTKTSSHGFLTSPRSRNLVAYEDRVYYPQTENDPLPEDCPNCLNRGGVMARCGMVEQRNYDLPLNALGQPMRANPQQVYTESSLVNITITLTAHHKGHFVFSACPIANTTTSPTQECFDAHPLTFVQDLLYGAPVDTNHPSRVYVAPSTIANRVNSNQEEFKDAMIFQYTLQLPQGLVGELVLLQWYYVASNSGCIHDGYESYPFPRAWIESSNDLEEDGEPSAWEEKWSVGTGLKSCNEVLSEDGDGIPEQFWNCAEITIQPKSSLDPLTSNLAAQIIPTNQHSKTIIGYYASWQWYDRDKLASPVNMDFKKISRVNFAFFQTDEAGNIWGTDSWADPNLLFGPYNWNPSPNETEYCSWDAPTEKVCKTHFYEEGLIHLVHAAGAEIYPSLGGWSLSDPFPAMSANEESRRNFANKCIELVEEYNFDGIDIDWEYPGYTDHSGTPEDTQSYNLLLQILREKLDELGARNNRFYGLTAALPCGPSNINNIDIVTAVRYLTELNLMTYDFFGAWSPTTGVNAPLYDQDWGGEVAKDLSVDGCVRNWVKGGGSPSAINIGLPFYGRSFLRAKGLNEKHEGNDKNTWFWDDGSPQFFNIIDKLPDMVSVRDELTKTQFAYHNSTMGGMVSYDDEEAICDKTEYCLEHELNGFIIWELSGDLMRDLSTPLLDAVHSKLNDPSLSCKTFVYNEFIVSDQSNVTDESFQVTATMSPTSSPLICPDGFSGSLPKNECREFYTCIFGKPVYPAIQCPDDSLFDEASSLCLPSSSVMCSLTLSPSMLPSHEPTSHARASLKPSDIPYGSITGISSMSLTSSLFPTREGTTVSPVFNVFVEQGPPSQDSFSSQPSASVDVINEEESYSITDTAQSNQVESSSLCANNFSGARPYNDCTEYYYCLNGEPNFPTIKCPPGTLFAEDQTFDNLISCIDQSQTTCSIGSASEPVFENEHTTEASQISNYLIPGNNAIVNATSNEEISHEESQPSPKSPSLSPISWMPPSTLIPTEVAITLALNQQQDNSANASNGSNSSVEETFDPKVEPTLTPPIFSFDGPFVTLEIKFGDKPSGIGWSVLSYDGTINVAKPPGTYSSYKPKATVYEAVSLDNGIEDHQLTVTLSNTYGEGLCCSGGNDGYFAIYNGQPESSNLLVHGGEFDFYVMLSLFLSADGTLHEVNEYLSSHDNDEVSAPEKPDTFTDEHVSNATEAHLIHTDSGKTESADALVDPQSGLNSISSEQDEENAPKLESHNDAPVDTSQQFGIDLATSNFEAELKPKSDNDMAILIPILAAVIVVSIFLGVVLLIIAHTKKSPPAIIDFDDEDNSIFSEDDDFSQERNRFDTDTAHHVQQIHRKSTLSKPDRSTCSNTCEQDENFMLADVESHFTSGQLRYSENRHSTDDGVGDSVRGEHCDGFHNDEVLDSNYPREFVKNCSHLDADTVCLERAVLEGALSLLDD